MKCVCFLSDTSGSARHGFSSRQLRFSILILQSCFPGWIPNAHDCREWGCLVTRVRSRVRHAPTFQSVGSVLAHSWLFRSSPLCLTASRLAHSWLYSQFSSHDLSFSIPASSASLGDGHNLIASRIFDDLTFPLRYVYCSSNTTSYPRLRYVHCSAKTVSTEMISYRGNTVKVTRPWLSWDLLGCVLHLPWRLCTSRTSSPVHLAKSQGRRRTTLKYLVLIVLTFPAACAVLLDYSP